MATEPKWSFKEKLTWLFLLSLCADMAALPGYSQGWKCSKPLRKLFLVNQENDSPQNKLSQDNFESCSQILQIKAVWEMVQISMQA